MKPNVVLVCGVPDTCEHCKKEDATIQLTTLQRQLSLCKNCVCQLVDLGIEKN